MKSKNKKINLNKLSTKCKNMLVVIVTDTKFKNTLQNNNLNNANNILIADKKSKFGINGNLNLNACQKNILIILSALTFVSIIFSVIFVIYFLKL